MLELRGAPALSDFRHAKLMAALRTQVPEVASLTADYVHFIDHDGDLSAEETATLERLLDYGSQPPAGTPDGHFFLVVPRIGTQSPWSSKATDICHNAGLAKVARVERGIEYRLTAGFVHCQCRGRRTRSRVWDPGQVERALQFSVLTILTMQYDQDEIDGIFRLYNSDQTEPTNIGNPKEFTIKELAQLILEETGSSSAMIPLPLPEDDPKVRQPDISIAKKNLGWQPKIDLRKGIRRTIPFLKAQLER